MRNNITTPALLDDVAAILAEAPTATLDDMERLARRYRRLVNARAVSSRVRHQIAQALARRQRELDHHPSHMEQPYRD